jgi:[phosphatase 2A protein]-leucine-carboxy methyltransferase
MCDELGTYVRTTAIDNLVNRFLDEPDDDNDGQPPRKKQIISLGAGSDTRVFRLFATRPSLQLVYHELDFSVNTAAKIRIIRSTPLLQRTLHIENPSKEGDVTISPEGDALHSPFYHIHPIDLRSLSRRPPPSPPTATGGHLRPSSSDSEQTSSSSKGHDVLPLLPGVDTSLPTLLISECCLVYLSPEDAAGVVDYFTKTLFPPRTVSPDTATTPLGLILYEPIRPNDAFGKTMVSNLATRGIQLQTLHKYASLDAQRQRLRDDHGLDAGQGAADIDFIWENWVSEAEKERVAGLEMLDEVEEWKLLAQHYCVAWGWRDGEGADSRAFDRWKEVQGQ